MIKSNEYLHFERDILNNNLISQILVKEFLLSLIDKINNDNSTHTLNSNLGEISYAHLKNIQTSFQMIEENINNINSLLEKINFITEEKSSTIQPNIIDDYNNTYYNCEKIISYNTLEIQKTINNLLSHIKFDFSFPNIDTLLSKKETTQNSSATVQSHIQNEIIEKKELKTTPNLEIKELHESKLSKIDSTILVDKTHNNNETIPLQDNVLLISDIKKKVILPYKVSYLQYVLKKKNKNYKNLEEIIEDKYTIPISYYKNTAISRFKEAYSLVKDKSHGSIKSAFDLGLELFFKYDLHPAIITACKNLDELDIYLACLEDNDLDSFKCFDIVYEALPVIKRNKKVLS